MQPSRYLHIQMQVPIIGILSTAPKTLVYIVQPRALSTMSTPAADLSSSPTGDNMQSEETKQPIETNGAEPVDEVLQPQDHGRGAWTFLIGAAIVEIAAWGRLEFEPL